MSPNTYFVIFILLAVAPGYQALRRPCKVPVRVREKTMEVRSKSYDYMAEFQKEWLKATKVELTDEQWGYFDALGHYPADNRYNKEPTYDIDDDTGDDLDGDGVDDEQQADVAQQDTSADEAAADKAAAATKAGLAAARMATEGRRKRSIITPPMKTRKEYRQLTSSERTQLHAALNAMKTNMIGSLSEYDIFVSLHRGANAPSAHFGAGFLGWHREFLWRFERALQVHNPSVFLPYWDSTLDQELPEPKDSYLWSSSLLGNNNGLVTTGPFANWDASAVVGCSGDLTRNAQSAPMAQINLLSDGDVSYVLGKSQYREITSYTGSPGGKFEGDHGGVHGFVGGHMGSITCSPSDPVFFMHHAFIDCIWETFRKHRQTTNPELEYPTNPPDGYIGGTAHAHFSPMEPFVGLVNMHGLSNHYTNYYYQCRRRPQWCCADWMCASPYLWCDRRNYRCKAKVRQGGDCTGLPRKACYGSGFLYGCYNNICQTIPPLVSLNDLQVAIG